MSYPLNFEFSPGVTRESTFSILIQKLSVRDIDTNLHGKFQNDSEGLLGRNQGGQVHRDPAVPNPNT